MTTLPPLQPDFEAMDGSLEELAEEQRMKLEQKKHICKCGHPHGRHAAQSDSPEGKMLRASGRELCRPGRRSCNCLKYEAVARAADPRPFLMGTTGFGNRHALFQGWRKCSLSDPVISVSWLPGVVCDGCSLGGLVLQPVPFTADWLVADSQQGHNKLLCETCLQTIIARNGAGVIGRWEERAGRQPPA